MNTFQGMSPKAKKDYINKLLKENPTYVNKKGLTLPNTYNSLMSDLELAIWRKQ